MVHVIILRLKLPHSSKKNVHSGTLQIPNSPISLMLLHQLNLSLQTHMRMHYHFSSSSFFTRYTRYILPTPSLFPRDAREIIFIHTHDLFHNLEEDDEKNQRKCSANILEPINKLCPPTPKS